MRRLGMSARRQTGVRAANGGFLEGAWRQHATEAV